MKFLKGFVAEYWVFLLIIVMFVLFGFRIFSVAQASTTEFDTNLSYGITGSQDVQALQEFLTVHGYYTGPITGNFYSLFTTPTGALIDCKGIVIFTPQQTQNFQAIGEAQQSVNPVSQGVSAPSLPAPTCTIVKADTPVSPFTFFINFPSTATAKLSDPDYYNADLNAQALYIMNNSAPVLVGKFTIPSTWGSNFMLRTSAIFPLPNQATSTTFTLTVTQSDGQTTTCNVSVTR